MHQLALTLAKKITHCLQEYSQRINFVILFLITRAPYCYWLNCFFCIVDSTNDRRPCERHGPTRGAGEDIPEGHHGDQGGAAAVREWQCMGGYDWEDEFSRN